MNEIISRAFWIIWAGFWAVFSLHHAINNDDYRVLYEVLVFINIWCMSAYTILLREAYNDYYSRKT